MRSATALLIAVALAGCTFTDPRPVYQPTTVATEGRPTLVVGVPRDEANAYTTNVLARELAFALAQRGRAALDLPTFLDQRALAGAPLPAGMVARLTHGVADTPTAAWLAAEGVTLLVFLEVPIYEQVWGATGKRTRVGLAARGRNLEDGEGGWRAFATPEVEDEPGRGFELATSAALGALARMISGESEPLTLPAGVGDTLRGRW